MKFLKLNCIFAARFFSHSINFIEIFRSKMSKSLNSSTENNPCSLVSDSDNWGPALLSLTGIIFRGDCERFAYFSDKNLIEIGLIVEKSGSKMKLCILVFC